MYGTIWHALLAAGIIGFACKHREIYDLIDDIAGMTYEANKKVSIRKRIKNYLRSRRGGSA